MKKLNLLILVLALGLPVDIAKADFTFGTPKNLGSPVNSSNSEGSPSLSTDGLELFFDSMRAGGLGHYDLWVAARTTIGDNWNPPVSLGSSINSSSFDGQPEISADGLSLFFASLRSGGQGEIDIWRTTRATKNDTWAKPVNLGSTVNSTFDDWSPSITADGLSLFFCSQRPGGYGAFDIWVATRTSMDDPWGQPANLGPTVNSSFGEGYVEVSANGLSIFFSEYTAPYRSGGFGGGDLWVTTRANKFDPWRTPVNLGPTVNTRAWDVSSNVSADGSTIHFSSDRTVGSGILDLYQVTILPIVDLNSDGIVDSADMCIMVDYWHTDESLCDIGPSPLGDGIVDVQDLIVLSEYLFEDINDPTLIAHWALDEKEGIVVNDSAGDNNGYAMGDPTWLPDGGLVDGALQLDGIDDYVITGGIPDPADRPLSVLAWIKGGAPGQVVISQTGGGVNWLMTDPIEGNLMTELTSPGRSGKPLQSQTNITDGEWHRIGFVWDGSNRTLYVDGIVVAEDTQAILEGSDNGLYIGCGKAMETGTYWSGLIDDVRVYNRAVTP